MADPTVTGSDIAALAGRLEAMADQFTAKERAALQALFHLAGAAVGEAVEVEGFGDGSVRPVAFSLPGGQPQGVLIGLDQAFGQGRLGGLAGTGLMLGDGSVTKPRATGPGAVG